MKNLSKQEIEELAKKAAQGILTIEEQKLVEELVSEGVAEYNELVTK